MHRPALVAALLTVVGWPVGAQTPRVQLLYKSRFGDSTFRASDTVIITSRALTIRGRFDLPGSPYALAAAAQQFASTIILDLTSYPNSDGFVHMVDPVEFEAKVTDLQPGRYVLYVRHNTVTLGLVGHVVKTIPVRIPE